MNLKEPLFSTPWDKSVRHSFISGGEELNVNTQADIKVSLILGVSSFQEDGPTVYRGSHFRELE